MSSLRRRLHVLFLWILTVRISITLFKTATLSSKFGNSSILFSNQTVILFVWWIIFSRFGEVRCFMSSFVHTLPTSSEGRTALKTNKAEICSHRNSSARSDCREFRKPRRRRPGQRRLKKMNLSFTYESRGTLKSFTLSLSKLSRNTAINLK